MNNNIIDSLMKRSKKSVAKKILTGAKYLGYGLAVGVPALMMNWYVSQGKELKVVENLLKRDTPQAQALALEKIADNPELLDDVSEDYTRMTSLEKAAFGKKNKISETNLEELVIEAPNRVSLSSDSEVKYFSGFEIEENTKLFPGTRLIYDSSNNALFELNKGNQKLEKSIGGVNSANLIGDSVYFSQGNDLFRIGKNKEIRVIQSNGGDNKKKLYSIRGTDYSVFTENKTGENLLLGTTGEIVGSDLNLLLDSVSSIKLDEYTKFTYKNNALYVSSKELILRADIKNNKVSITEFDSPWNRYFNDYSIQDVNRDGRDDIAFFDCGNFYNSYDVHTQKEDGKYKKSHSISGGAYNKQHIHFNHNLDSYAWLNPKQLKTDVKNHLRSSRRKN